MDTKQHGSGPWRVERPYPYKPSAVPDANARELALVLIADDHSLTNANPPNVSPAPPPSVTTPIPSVSGGGGEVL